MKTYTTKRKPLGFMAQVCTREGNLTGFNLFVPYDSPMRFTIGSLEFDVRQTPKGKHLAYAQGELPQSWFVDLNKD